MAAVCVLVGGRPEYAQAATQAIYSVLDHSDFDVYVAHNIPIKLPFFSSGRVFKHLLQPPSNAHRSYRFLQKFEALNWCLEEYSGEFIILLDADAVFVSSLDDDDISSALGDRDIGLVEQTGIRGSTMGREEFLEHYSGHSATYISTNGFAQELDKFRFYNSGVVLARRDSLGQLVAWAKSHIENSVDVHQVGEHMIADQDYFQVWCNALHPDSCKELPWLWNHCELWDDGFPRPECKIAHFSNFCNGPAQETIERMRNLRQRDVRFSWFREIFR